MDTGSPYSKHLDVLTALITYLALTVRKSRTAQPLARDLSLPSDVVEEVFDKFPGIFRKSRSVDTKGKPFYTIHARYALRSYDDGSEDVELPELRAEILKALLQFVTENARAERAHSHLEAQLRAARRNANLAAIAATVAAAVALTGVLLTLVFGSG